MQNVHLALVQGTWTGDQSTTQALYRDLIAQATSGGASLILLPEFTLCPYFPGTQDPKGFSWAESLDHGISVDFFAEMASTHHVTIIGSLFELTDGKYWDTATLHGPDGKMIGFTRKVHIPSGEGYYETDFFGGAADYPIHDTNAIRVAAPTCYDQWFPEMARLCAMNGAELIAYPTAIGSEPTAPDYDSSESWQTVMRGHAVANGVFVAAANRVGIENGVTFYGSSFICDPRGRVIAQASRDKVEIIHAVLDAAVREQTLELFPLLYQRRPDTYQNLTHPITLPPPERWKDHPAFKPSN